ncbi:L-aspartate oxidase [Tranquillimonas rosea]|uniref:L-aspartate oxidase n=1 Tax=Tranquillimonas rosea TaxID=641238 RepID=A0A1H9VQB7_9RHOB|nr:L-aspartate oxidase [Tranquillimonas rosea]SES23782.1 L-aspartate oxidase [Tranquillimonas rosea]
MDGIRTDRVVIVGAGIAALYAALALAPHPVLVVSPDRLGGGASSAWAQGGVAAAMAASDSAARHADDTVRAGSGTVDRDVALSVAAEAREHILGLTALGAPFDRTTGGDYILSREAAHAVARVVRVGGDRAGAAIMATLIDRVRATPSVQVLEGVQATGLIHEAGRVAGVRLGPATGGGPDQAVRGPAVLLAGGGSAGLYAVTTNPPRVRGQVIGMAARAGAEIADAEFVQFHPTAIDVGRDPAPLATEALRGDGAILVNRTGARFMTDAHPDAELAPRDVVARAIFAQTRAGMVPALDTRAALGDRIVTQYPTVAGACRATGIDPVTGTIPVAAAAHYHMGGIATDAAGRSSLSGLWACGEAASTGLHGANRLASNGLLEALVYSRRAARDIARDLDRVATVREVALAPEGPSQPAVAAASVAALRRTMTDRVGVVRDGAGLRQALRDIARIDEAAGEDATLRNMTATATLIAAAALSRTESRGAHHRSDHPDTAAEARRSRLTLVAALAVRRDAELEPT